MLYNSDMVKLRLALNKGSGSFSIVVAESSKRRDGKCIQKIGYYNPRFSAENSQRLKMDLDTVSHFIQHGAQPTERVAKLVKQYSASVNYTLNDFVKAKIEEKASYVIKTTKAEAASA